jgi:hypothetical protein
MCIFVNVAKRTGENERWRRNLELSGPGDRFQRCEIDPSIAMINSKSSLVTLDVTKGPSMVWWLMVSWKR